MTILTLHEPNYSRISEGELKAVLNEPYRFHTPIRGYSAWINNPDQRCQLYPDGTLVVYKGLKWDFGSGAVDTKSMQIASLAHDAFCWLTDQGKLPWAVRKKADKYFRTLLYAWMCHYAEELPFWRRDARKTYARWRAWRSWVAVKTYSQRIAKKKALPYKPQYEAAA